MCISIACIEFQCFACKIKEVDHLLPNVKGLLKSKDLKCIHSLNKLSTCQKSVREQGTAFGEATMEAPKFTA